MHAGAAAGAVGAVVVPGWGAQSVQPAPLSAEPASLAQVSLHVGMAMPYERAIAGTVVPRAAPRAIAATIAPTVFIGLIVFSFGPVSWR